MGVGSDFNRLESVFGHVHLYLLDMWNKLVSKGAAKWTIIIETQGFMDLFSQRLPANKGISVLRPCIYFVVIHLQITIVFNITWAWVNQN